MSGFTPGPWTVGHRHSTTVIRGEDSGCVAVIPSLKNEGHGYVSPLERQANARLIAAAPDLLEALRSAADFIEDEAENRSAAGSRYSDYEGGPRDLLERIDAAISKATGEAA